MKAIYNIMLVLGWLMPLWSWLILRCGAHMRARGMTDSYDIFSYLAIVTPFVAMLAILALKRWALAIHCAWTAIAIGTLTLPTLQRAGH